MAKYTSGRQKNLKVGISSYSENLTSLEVIGKVGIGTTNAGSTTLFVVGDVQVSGILTANRLYSNVYGEFTGGGISGTNIVGTALSVSGISTFGGSNGVLIKYEGGSGIVTSANAGVTTVTYYGDGSNLTNIQPSSISGTVPTAGIATYTSEWILGAVGNGDYTFAGPGFTGAESDPILYLVRGQQYKFTNTMGMHPFRIQSTPNGSAGTEYNDGITNNNVSNGTLTWNVQFDSPSLLYYQCTVHGSMGGKIYIIDAGIGSDISVNTTGIITASSFIGTSLSISGVSTVGFLTASNVYVSGVTTSNAYYIGVNQVISSSRQLQNIASLDASTTATIEDAIKVAPNDFNNLNISGISTLQTTTIIGGGTSTGTAGQVLQVTGISSGAYIGGNLGIGSTNPTSKLSIQGDVRISGVVTATRYFGNIQIGTPSGGFQTGAVAITTDSNTNDIVDYINNILGKLVPKPPTTINGVTLTLSGLTGTGALCSGFSPTNNAGIGVVTPTAGTTYNRNNTSTTTISSVTLTQYGPGDSGTVTAFINSVGVGTTTLSSGSNNGTYGSLVISNDKDAFNSTRNTGIASGFYEIYDVAISNASSPTGFNCASIRQGISSTTSPFWYQDPSTVAAPIIGIGSTTTPSVGTHVVSYSSGIPHYTESANNTFTYVITCTNATGDMYSTNTFCTTGGATNGFQTPGSKSYTDFAGGVNPPVRNYGVGTGVTALASQVPINTHIQVSSTTDKLSTFTASTPYGSSGAVRGNVSQTINIMGSTASTSKIDEDNIVITSLGTGSGNSVRVNGGLGSDNPTPIYTAWSPSTSIGSSEAVIVGGVLKYDATNYSTGYLPVGPDYSTGRATSQYIQFEIIRSNVSQFKIIITGTYAGCWVCMPNNSTWTTSLSGKNGWADMFVAYRGSGVPTTAQPGCASGTLMSGSSGTFTSVFGTESSSNDTNNRILVRFKLTSGQSITGLSFSS